eukprot:7210962-Pyramimonas_sp.AAC.2
MKSPNWSRWVNSRSAVAQGCRTQARGLRVGRAVTASVLAMLRSYVHSVENKLVSLGMCYALSAAISEALAHIA